MAVLDDKLQDELVAREEKEHDFRLEQKKKAEKKSLIKKLLEKLFKKDEDDDADEHEDTLAL